MSGRCPRGASCWRWRARASTVRLKRGTAIEAEGTGPGDVLGCLLRLGYGVTRHIERVTAGIAEDNAAIRFDCPDRPVVFRLVRATWSDYTVLGVIHISALADRFELSYECCGRSSWRW